MEKLETRLANKFLVNLKKSVSDHGERIKINKIHGDVYQKAGMSDWVGCWKGLFVAIEFKVLPNIMTDGQITFLTDIIECGGIGIAVTFRPDAEMYTWGQEYRIMHHAYEDRLHSHYNFRY